MTPARESRSANPSRSSLSANVPSDGEVAKTAVALARRIANEVIAEGWPVDRWLGSEPDLIEQYGVSRSAFREAVRLLEHRGVARMRTGPGGGLIVSKPDASVVTDAAALFLDYQRVQPSHLFNARSALELKCIDLIGSTLTSDACDRLQAVLDAEAGYTPAEIAEHSDEFHLVLAELTEDPVLVLFLRVLTELTGGHAFPAAYDTLVEGTGIHQTCRDHKRIAKALMNGSPEKASTLMLRHLKWVADGLVFLERDFGG